MDNLINNAVAGMPSFAVSGHGVANSASIAIQWQQQLVTPALAMTIAPGVMAEQSTAHATIDTSLMLSLQQVTTDSALTQQATGLNAVPYYAPAQLDTTMLEGYPKPVEPNLLPATPESTQPNTATLGGYPEPVEDDLLSVTPKSAQPNTTTLAWYPETVGADQLSVTPDFALRQQINPVVTQSTVTSVTSGQKTQVESRLLSWGNTGQGVLSYMSAYTNGSNMVGAPNLQVNSGNAHTGGVSAPVAVTPALTSNPSQISVNQSSVGAVSARQLATQQKDSASAVQQNQKAMMGYDITPQALFFVLSGQQGYRATVRDYFNKEDTLKRLYQLQQDNLFGFSNVQEIWLNGKPLNQQRQQDTEHAS